MCVNEIDASKEASLFVLSIGKYELIKKNGKLENVTMKKSAAVNAVRDTVHNGTSAPKELWIYGLPDSSWFRSRLRCSSESKWGMNTKEKTGRHSSRLPSSFQASESETSVDRSQFISETAQAGYLNAVIFTPPDNEGV